MWRLRFLPWRWIAIGTVAVLAAGGVALGALLVFGGGGSESKADSGSIPVIQPPSEDLYYLQAVAPETKARGCTMKIRFVWKPHYHALRYVGDPAVIQVRGSGIAGTYTRRFTTKGVSLETPPVSLRGGYQLWSATVATLGGKRPGNNTTVQAAPPTPNPCT